MIDRRHLHLGHYSLRHAPLRERFAAAAAAGFSGIGVSWTEVEASATARQEIKSLLDAAGLRASMLEVVRLPDAVGLAAFAAESARAAGAAAELDCPIVLAVDLNPGTDARVTQTAFAMLARACADQGRRCAIEFIPFLSSVPDLGTARQLVRAVEAPGAGVVIDALHFMRSGAPWAELEALAPDEIAGIQVCDGPLEPPTADYLAEAMGLRVPPGEGEFDLPRFVRALGKSGATVPLTCEVISDELARLSPHQAARRMADSMRTLPGRTQPMESR